MIKNRIRALYAVYHECRIPERQFAKVMQSTLQAVGIEVDDAPGRSFAQEVLLGWSTRLEYTTSVKYGGSLFELSADDPGRLEAQEASATSDPIERIFGLASYLRSTNPNQTRENMDNQMAVIDQKFGTHLLDLLAVDEERGSRIMLRQREFSKTYATKLKSRSLQTMAARKKVLDDEADKQRRKVLAE